MNLAMQFRMTNDEARMKSEIPNFNRVHSGLGILLSLDIRHSSFPP